MHTALVETGEVEEFVSKEFVVRSGRTRLGTLKPLLKVIRGRRRGAERCI